MYEKKPFIIAVDVDQTLLDLVGDWMKWCSDQVDHEITLEAVTGVSGCLQDRLESLGVHDPISFWKQPDLYDEAEPFEKVKECLALLGLGVMERLNRNVEFVAVSRCFPEHIDSKRNFLDKHFPGVFLGFIDTAEKKYVNFDVIIDDSIDTVEQVYGSGRKIIMPSSHALNDLRLFNPKEVMELGESGFAGSGWNPALFCKDGMLIEWVVS